LSDKDEWFNKTFNKYEGITFAIEKSNLQLYRNNKRQISTKSFIDEKVKYLKLIIKPLLTNAVT